MDISVTSLRLLLDLSFHEFFCQIIQVFFVIRLQSAETISKLGPICDPDAHMQCDLMDGRDAFLTLAREKHYEFSSLRRTKVI